MEDKKQNILEAAAELLLMSPMGWSTTLVADMACCTQPLIHYHWESKEKLLNAAYLWLAKKYGVQWLNIKLGEAIQDCVLNGNEFAELSDTIAVVVK